MINILEIPEIILNSIPLPLLAESYARVNNCSYFEKEKENYNNILISLNNAIHPRFKKIIHEETISFSMLQKMENFLNEGTLKGVNLASFVNSCFIWDKIRIIDMPFIHLRLNSPSLGSKDLPFTKISKLPTLSYDY